MNLLNLRKSAGVFLLFALTHATMAQDNGNVFVKTWGADATVFKGDWGELAAYAPEGMDIDQDHHREFIVYDHVTGVFNPEDRLQLWENRGDNDFFLAWEHKYTDVKSQFQQGHAIAVADLDFDSKQEVLIVTGGILYIYEWNGTAFETGVGLPQEPTCKFFPYQDNTGACPIRQLRVVNLDQDPEPELFFGYSTNVGMYVSIASLANRDFTDPQWKDEYADPFSIQDGWRVGGVAIDDFDRDGKMEMFTTNWQDAPTTRLYENDGIDNYVIKFTTLPSTLILDPSYDDSYANPIFHDFDGDGDSEFVITDIHGKMFVITKQASNNFEDFGPSAWKYVMTFPEVLMNGFVRSGFLHDLDQDGKPDIYYNDKGAVGKGGVYDLEYQGGPVTSPDSWKVYKIYDNNGHMSVAGEVYPAGDLDGDGHGELVIVAWSNQPQDLVVIESVNEASSVENEDDLQLPGECVLHQNFPNPFNASTRITYDLIQPASVRLTIYSVSGQYITTLVDEEQSAGRHTVHFDASRLAAGVYTCRIVAGNFIQQKKMLYLK